MNLTYITTTILRPGAKIRAWDDSYELYGENDMDISGMLGPYLYSATRNKVIQDGDWLENDKGCLAETLFIMEDMVELESGVNEAWLRDYMADGNWADLEYDLPALYQVAASHVDLKEKKDRYLNAPDHGLIIHVSFLGGWAIHTSKGGIEDLYPEIDRIEFTGEYIGVPKPDN